MKILIIGSKGFIGSNCTKYFKTIYNVRECDVVAEYGNPNYYLVDATNADYSSIFQENSFDVCINCSGAASVPNSLTNPQRDYFLNTVNVFRLLDSIRKFNPQCKFLNLSSAAVYGNPETIPINEDCTINPLSPYGFHKASAERICEEFTQFYNIKTCNLRIFSCYGNGLKKQLFWDLFKKINNSDSIELFGTGNESRDFIHVHDLVKQIHLVLKNAPFEAEAINSANGVEVTISEAVEVLIQLSGWKGKVRFQGENRKGDPANWCANIKIIEDYGYKQAVSFEEGLKSYLQWAKENV